jgi:hypothetical protein
MVKPLAKGFMEIQANVAWDFTYRSVFLFLGVNFCHLMTFFKKYFCWIILFFSKKIVMFLHIVQASI